MEDSVFHVQKILFERIEALKPANANLAIEISELLEVSLDGAYRRIRGLVHLKMQELIVIATKYQLSIDELFLDQNPAAVAFLPSSLQHRNTDMEPYSTSLSELMKTLRKEKAHDIIIVSKDLPTFQLFQFPKLLQFKMFFWRKTMFEDPEFNGVPFSLNNDLEDVAKISTAFQGIARQYAQMDSTEIWNAELANGLIKQIRYYLESGLFKDPKEAILLIDEAEKMVEFLQKMAKEGRKLLVSDPKFVGGSYKLFHNDIIVNDNVMSARIGNSIRTFHVYNSIEYLQTGHKVYGEQVRSWLENLPKRSEPISEVAELLRLRFFNRIRHQLMILKNDLEKYLSSVS
ncbi:MAG: hypothetical protein NWR72_20170 [Bacteroidia bacterium]|nr:hypothetical protein [Bacteroidia bacterium]